LRRIRASDSGKLHSRLRALANTSGQARQKMLKRFPNFGSSATAVTINVVAKGDGNALKAQLQALGMTNARAFGSVVSGRVPIDALNAVAANAGVQNVRPVFAHTRAGIVTSQGDRAQRSYRARGIFGVDGRGVRVGILSDSFGCLTGPIFDGQLFSTTADDIQSHDLPRDIKILDDLQGDDCNDALDEGRAIGQIIHDVAPGASLAFHTAFRSEADLAQGIIDLANAGSKIIIDDVIYYDEPMFQDGIVAQAVDTVKARGVAYFSSAGNDARASYESPFRKSNSVGESGVRHNFGTRQQLDPMQTITVTDQADELVMLNWDEPSRSAGGAASRSDVDIIYYDLNGDPIPFCDDPSEPLVCQLPGVDRNIGGDAVEFSEILNFSGADVDVQLSIELFKGPTPGYLKYVYFDLGAGTIFIDEHDTQSGASYGHAIAAGAAAVGAAGWYNTAAWGSPFHGADCVPACLEPFSSAGGVPILFDKSGKRLRSAQVRQKPNVTGPDGGNSTFFFSPLMTNVPGSTEVDAFPNFFGTSASAPHVAAIAALMIDKQNRARRAALSPDRIYKVLQETAKDMRNSAGRLVGPFPFMNGEGFDFDSGYGFVDAVAALEEVGD
jgi:hypothetical protein